MSKLYAVTASNSTPGSFKFDVMLVRGGLYDLCIEYPDIQRGI